TDLLAGSGQVVEPGLAAGEQGLPGPGRIQRLEPVVLDLVGAAGGAVHRGRRVHGTAPQADVDPALLEALALGHRQGVLDVGDGHVLAADGDALAAEHVAAEDRHVVSSHDVRPAVGAADQAAGVGGLGDVGGVADALAADGEADPAAA